MKSLISKWTLVNKTKEKITDIYIYIYIYICVCVCWKVRDCFDIVFIL